MNAFSKFSELIQYGYMQRAIIVGTLVSLCSSLLGVTLVLKKFSMIGDGLSHVGYGAVAIALCFSVAPLKIAIPLVLVSAFFLLKISENSKFSGDSAIAVISSASLAIGVAVNSLSGGTSANINSYMFGTIMSIGKDDLVLSIVMLSIVISLFIFGFRHIFAISFDENYYRAVGGKAELMNVLIAGATAITIVTGLKIMGAMLISGLIVFPALSAMQNIKSYKGVFIVSGIFSVLAFLLGIFISSVFDMPTGASIVIVNVAVFIVSYLVKLIRFGIRNAKAKV